MEPSLNKRRGEPEHRAGCFEEDKIPGPCQKSKHGSSIAQTVA